MRRSIQHGILFALTLTLLFSILIVPAYAATSAKFSTGSTCRVTISHQLIKKKGYQYATVKLKTHSMGLFSSWNSGGKVTVSLYDGTTGRHIWSGQKHGGDTLRLGDDHTSYIIKIAPYSEKVTNSIWSKTVTGGNNFTNLGKCNRWSISNPKNCTIR